MENAVKNYRFKPVTRHTTTAAAMARSAPRSIASAAVTMNRDVGAGVGPTIDGRAGRAT